jgi:hypothetical protein
MKKTYAKPALDKRVVLPSVTAQNSSPQLIPSPAPE